MTPPSSAPLSGPLMSISKARAGSNLDPAQVILRSLFYFQKLGNAGEEAGCRLRAEILLLLFINNDARLDLGSGLRQERHK